jgi:protein farnesyltransferase/geranylgeranyltransferase type-1 subunit alpha
MEWLQGEVGIAFEKNYQIWHHRRCIAETLDKDFDSDAERHFMMKIFASDRKNYHAWQYLVWLVERFALWDDFDISDAMLDQDVKNNSAWSFRYFHSMRQPNPKFEPGTKEFVEAELNLILNKRLPQDFTNESAWVYLRGLLCQTEEEATASQNTNVKRVCIKHFISTLKPFLEKVVKENDQ